LFEATLEKAQQSVARHGFRFKNPLYSVDATTIDLCLKLFPWADFRKRKGGINLTVKLDHQGKIPSFAAESNAREHDSKKIRSVPFAANDMTVFDRGYADYRKIWGCHSPILFRLLKLCCFKGFSFSNDCSIHRRPEEHRKSHRFSKSSYGRIRSYFGHLCYKTFFLI
jgi:hypothetical protein